MGDGLFPSYQLPNGKQMYMYYNGGALLDEVCAVRIPGCLSSRSIDQLRSWMRLRPFPYIFVCVFSPLRLARFRKLLPGIPKRGYVPRTLMTRFKTDTSASPPQVHVDAVLPPPRPTTVPQALQQSMPLAEVLNLISKPPGSAPPFIPYKPVPYLVPLPSRHTLAVKAPNVLSATAFGDLREDNLQLVIQVGGGRKRLWGLCVWGGRVWGLRAKMGESDQMMRGSMGTDRLRRD